MLFVVSKPKDTSWAGPTPWPIVHRIVESLVHNVKTQGEALDAGLKRYRGQLDYIESPQAAARWYQAQYSDPVVGPHLQSVMPMEQTLAEIPQDPQEFQKWRKNAAMGMEAYQKEIFTNL